MLPIGLATRPPAFLSLRRGNGHDIIHLHISQSRPGTILQADLPRATFHQDRWQQRQTALCRATQAAGFFFPQHNLVGDSGRNRVIYRILVLAWNASMDLYFLVKTPSHESKCKQDQYLKEAQDLTSLDAYCWMARRIVGMARRMEARFEPRSWLEGDVSNTCKEKRDFERTLGVSGDVKVGLDDKKAWPAAAALTPYTGQTGGSCHTKKTSRHAPQPVPLYHGCYVLDVALPSHQRAAMMMLWLSCVIVSRTKHNASSR
jgi:hypothetical protein